ncbi:MAG TPA: hypothetical protein VIR77_04600, partial [Pontiella sp.]
AGLLFRAAVIACGFVECASGADSPAVATLPERPGVTQRNFIDTAQGAASTRIASLARWVDSFFDDPDYAAEEAYARASISQSATFYRDPDAVYRTSIRASIILPNLSNRLRLAFEGNDELYAEDTIGEPEPNLPASTRESLDDPSLRLHYTLLQRYETDLRMTGGFRLEDSAFYAGPRFKLRTRLSSDWDAVLTQRLLWYTTETRRSKTELRLNRILGTRNLFRQAFRTDWYKEREENDVLRHTVTTSLAQPLKKTAAFRYAWSSVYFAQPESGWISSTASVGYRRSAWRDWIILEAEPFVRWERQYDWEPNAGITFSISAIFEEKKLPSD